MLPLKLEKPLVVFDLETTGPDVARDRIVQIALIRLEPGGARTVFETLVNPEMPIPPDATRVHGIRDEDVAGKPPLKALAPKIVELLAGADLAGFNSARFDLPLLQNDLARVGVKLETGGARHLDAMRIYHLKERRDLEAAYLFYCGKSLDNAHSAAADAAATLEVLEAQLARYPDLPRDLDGLHRLCNPDDGRYVDASRKFEWGPTGEVVFAFGKYRGTPLRQVAHEKRDYLEWMLGADFPEDVKGVLQEALAGRFPRRR